MTSKYVWRQISDSSGCTEGRSAECLKLFSRIWDWREVKKPESEGPESGVRRRPLVGSRSNGAGGGRGGGGGGGAKPPEAEGFFFYLNLSYEKPHFLVLYPVTNSHSQNILHCALKLSSRGTNQAQTKVNIQRLYTPNINNKGSIHNHLSFWSYVLVYVSRSSCQQLTKDSIQNRKQI